MKIPLPVLKETVCYGTGTLAAVIYLALAILAYLTPVYFFDNDKNV
jgi:hypothetical protein